MTDRIRRKFWEGQRPGKPKAAVSYYGEALASWLLNSEALEEAGLEAPTLPSRQGIVLPIFTRKVPAQSIFASGFVLPMQWIPDAMEASELPLGVAKVAHEVKEALRGARELARYPGIEKWGLRLAEEAGDVDLSELNVECPSIAAPLAASLLVAHLGGKPKPDVLSTGSWSHDGIRQVSSFGHKLAAVNRYAGELRPTVFVPGANLLEAQSEAERRGYRFQIKAYPVGNTHLYQNLLEHLRALDSPPHSDSHDLDECKSYLNRPYMLRAPARLRTEYYLQHVVARLTRQQDLRRFSDKRPIKRMAIPVSFRYDVCVLPILALGQVEEVLLIPTPDTEGLADEVQKHVGQVEPEVRFSRAHHFTLGGAAQQIDAIQKWLEGEPESSARAVEITGGQKTMSAMLIAAAQRAQARIFYVEHEVREGLSPVIGSEGLQELTWLYGVQPTKTAQAAS